MPKKKALEWADRFEPSMTQIFLSGKPTRFASASSLGCIDAYGESASRVNLLKRGAMRYGSAEG
jgi:hypothetical protein